MYICTISISEKNDTMNVRENQKGHVGGFKEEREIRHIEIILQSQRLEKYKKEIFFKIRQVSHYSACVFCQPYL